MLRQLTEAELKETLDRARQIAGETGELEAGGELDNYVEAAAEIGIPAEAMRQALRERAPLIRAPLAVGDAVFAPSADGHWYPARLIDLDEQRAQVRFLSGADHHCPPRDLQPLSLIPGRKLQGDIKGWGWYDCRVERFDADRDQVHVVHDDWSGHKEKLALTKVRLQRHHVYPETAAPQGGERVPASAVAWAAGIGVMVGLALPHLLRLLPFF